MKQSNCGGCRQRLNNLCPIYRTYTFIEFILVTYTCRKKSELESLHFHERFREKYGM